MQNGMKILFLSFAFLTNSANAQEVDPIKSMIASISEWVPICEDSASKESCEDNDAALWNGLMCYSNPTNYVRMCQSLKNSQGPDGRVWRSPRKVGAEGNNTFSNDMALGVLFYLLATKDQTLGANWMSYIKSHRSLCPERGSSCSISNRLSDAISDVYSFLGWSNLVPTFIHDATDSEDLGWAFEAQFTAPGYSLYRLGLYLLIQKVTQRWDNDKQRAADVMYNKQTQNIFYLWLNEGPTYNLCNRVLGLAPIARPDQRNKWTWENIDSAKSWRQSVGWEFLFLGESCVK